MCKKLCVRKGSIYEKVLCIKIFVEFFVSVPKVS